MTTLAELDGSYALDPHHTEIGFVARHAMVTKVRGAFGSFEGLAVTGPGLEGASIDLTFDVKSIDTRNADRDAHLRSADFFDVEKFPHITFVSVQVDAADADTLRITGELTIKDVKKTITFDLDYTGSAEDPFGNERIGFEGSVDVNRKDWGLEWNAALESGGVLVSEKVRLQFDISAIKKS